MAIPPKESDIIDFSFGLEQTCSGSAVFRCVNVYKHIFLFTVELHKLVTQASTLLFYQ